MPQNNCTINSDDSNLFWEEVSIPTDWGVIKGKKHCGGPRCVLAIHGWLDNANSFDLVLPFIKDGITIISIDLPGHGLSGHFPPGFFYDIKGYVGVIKKVVTELKWEKFTLMAHSIGAIFGIVYCAVFPEDVNTFISIDIIKAWSINPPNWGANMKRYLEEYFKNEKICTKPPLEYEENELIQKTIEGSKSSLDAESAKLLLKRGSTPSTCGTKRVLTRDPRVKPHFLGFAPFETWYEYVKSIKCPILIVKATEGRLYDSPEDQEIILNAFKEGSPLFKYCEVDGKHHIHITHSSIVGPLLKDFLDSSQPFVEQA